MTMWMIWATAVTLVLALAAAALERCLRLFDLPGRVAWVGAASGAVGLICWSLAEAVTGGRTTRPTGAVDALATGFARNLAAAVPVPGALALTDALLAWAWAVSAALLLCALGCGLWRLSRKARSWPVATVAGGEVLLSHGFGPALVGVWSPRIVVPRWALRLGAERLRMAYLHEAEHRRAGDGLLLLGSALLTAAAPWNVGLWWIHARLRTAVEMDCDRRVLEAGAHPVAYGSLLLELGTRTRGVPLMVAAFARPRATLERRMMMIVNGRTDMGVGRYGRAAAGLAVAGVLVAVACDTPAPTTLLRPAETAEVSAEALTEPSSSPLTEAPLRLQRTSPRGAEGVDPLIFVDGVLVAGGAGLLDSLDPGRRAGLLENLDPRRIERIEVLKGAAAVRLFTEEAAGGVIQIFLKAEGGER
jgi:hypothetical protein